MTGARALLVAPVVALLLAGCAVDGRGEVREAVEAVTAAANERDADGVRDAVDDLLAELDRQVASGELQSPEAARIAALARQVRDSAVLVDQEAIDAERRAREEAERKAQEEAARKAQEEADRKAQEEAARKAEEDARKAEEDARKAEEELRKAEEEARKAQEEAGKGENKKDDQDEDGDGDGGG